MREESRKTKRSLGRKRFEVPGYTFRVFVTNRLQPAEEVWRDYHFFTQNNASRSAVPRETASPARSHFSR